MATYRLDPVAFRALVLNADWMQAEMLRRADEAKAWAETNAPDAPPLGVGYRDSFSTEVHADGGIHHDRAEATLSSDDPAALSIEFGHAAPDGRHIEGSHTLTHAMDMLGS